MASARSEERSFKVFLTMTRSEDSSPVFFKVDGERFKESRTLKLQVEKVALEFRPPMVLTEATISGGTLKPELTKNDDVHSCYEGTFDTHGTVPSKSKDRVYIVLCLKFSDVRELNAQIQSKFYSLKDKNHLMWGTCLKSLDFECKNRDGQSFVDVQKMLFR